MRRAIRTLWLLLVAALALAGPAHAQAVRVFAAASLTEAVNEVADAYAATGKPRPTLVFAASSALARQIEQGAPAGIFMSADTKWADYLDTRKLLAANTRRDLLTNRLALIVPVDKPRKIAIRQGFDFAGLIGDGRWATGDPDAVPVGKYAKAALTKLGVWTSVEGKLARAENVRSALAFVERGEAAAGIVYVTDARATAKVAVAGVFPANSHPPIVYPAAVVAANDNAEARDFFTFLRSSKARAIYRARGFGLK